MMRNMYLSAAEGQRNNGKDDHKLHGVISKGTSVKSYYILVMHLAQLTETLLWYIYQ